MSKANNPEEQREGGVPPLPESAQAQKSAAGFPIVGIGASAGGLEALGQFMAALSARTGMAFVVIQHMYPSHPSAMPALLQRYTSLPVAEAKEGTKVEVDHVYVIPPSKSMSLRNRTLRLHEQPSHPDQAHNIDLFFLSLAEDLREKAVGIVLSGTGHDGAQGVKAIKAEAGLVIAQKPESAKYDGMPRAAIATGAADVVLAPAEMPVRLVDFARNNSGEVLNKRREALEEQSLDLQKIFALIRMRTKRDFSQYKPSTISRRIERRMGIARVDRLGDYMQLLSEDPREVDALFKDLLINVTSFFRDPEAFELIKSLLKERLASKSDGAAVRAWTVGCSTGEEPYSLAMVIEECMEELGKYFEVQVFGTDIDPDAISMARAGIYPSTIVEVVSEERLNNFFVRKDNQFQIKKEIREKVVFAIQDFTADPPFSRLDLISARNILIYLGGDLQRKLVPVLHYALSEKGLLFLGTAETIGEFDTLFETVDRKWKIFARRTVSGELKLALPSQRSWLDIPPPPPRTAETIATYLSQRSLLQCLPPTVLIDSNYRIVYVQGETSRFLELSQGEPSMGILDMARQNLRSDLSAVLLEAASAKKEVTREGASLKIGGKSELVRIVVTPITGIPERQGFFAVSFSDVPAPPEVKKKKGGGESDSRSQRLEQELQFTRESLRSTIEELETANEELRSANEEYQSTNEELQSTNEELETSREELQSVNEELMTVNTEYQNKIEELSVVNDDMMNLLNSTDLATIYLDDKLVIQRFTPTTTRIFNLIDTDVGRPLEHVTSNLELSEMAALARGVLDTLVPHRRDVRARDGRWYSMRMHPYRTTQNSIAGIVISFIDVSEYAAAAEAAAQGLHGMLDAFPGPALLLSSALTVERANAAFCDAFGIRESEARNRAVYALKPGAWDVPALHALLEKVLAEKDSVKGHVLKIASSSGERAFDASALILGKDVPHVLLSLREMKSGGR